MLCGRPMILHSVYNNINNVFTPSPFTVSDSSYGSRIAYFGVMVSFGAGVYKLSELCSYLFFVGCRDYLKDFRNKMFNAPSIWGLGRHISQRLKCKL